MMKRLLLPLAALALAGPAAAQTVGQAELTLRFEVGTAQGAVMVALFDSEGGYQGSKPLFARHVAAGAEPVAVRFSGLAPGRYAAKAFHDVNGDEKMNANPFGMPTEPFGFSNGAQPRMGPPAWSEAAFEVRAGANAQTIVLR